MGNVRLRGTITAEVLMLALCLGSRSGLGAPGAGRPRTAAAEPAPDELTRALHGGAVKPAVEAASALGQRGDAAARETLLTALAVGAHPEVAGAIAEALARWGSSEVVAAWAQLLTQRNPALRARVIDVVARHDSPAAERMLLDALADVDGSVRARAAEAVRVRRLRRAVPVLRTLLARGDEVAVIPLAELADMPTARQVIDLVGRIDDALVGRCLGAMLLAETLVGDEVRLEIVEALRKMPRAVALAALGPYLAAPARPAWRGSRARARETVDMLTAEEP